MTTLTPYPAYKDSGLECIDALPAHWETHRAKNVLKHIDVRSTTGAEELLSVSENDGVIPRREKAVTMFMAESYVGHKMCWPNDLVINSLWAWRKGLGVSKYHGIVSSAYGVYRLRQPIEHDPRYLHKALRSTMYDRELRVRSKGVWTSRLQLTDESFLDMPLVLPPLDEQRAIADFLDGMDARITRFIAARRKMIALLEEQKQAVINQAVIRGLDPSVPLKDSGVDWLGEIPAHWEMRRLKAMVATPLQYGANESGEPFEKNLPRYVRITDIAPDGSLREGTKKSLTWEAAAPYILQSGDVLMARSGATVGKSFIYRDSWGTSGFAGYLIRARLRTSLLMPDFFKRFTESAMYWSWIRSSTIQATIENVSAEKYGNLEIPLPPVQEQEAIVNHLDCEIQQVDAIIARSRREMELMQEYRTRLISDVVTGKLDVRGVELAPVEVIVREEIETALEDEESGELVDELEGVEA